MKAALDRADSDTLALTIRLRVALRLEFAARCAHTPASP